MTTIKDIARACNVSTATVSYVINGKSTLLPETREKVLRVMRQMNYHPSAIARGLTNKRMNTLGIQFDNLGSNIAVTHPYSSGILQGAVTAGSEAGYNITLFTELWRDAEKSLPKFRDQRVDGIIIVAPPSDLDILPSLSSAALKVVTISAASAEYNMPMVDVDNAYGVRLAVMHLRALGHERIAFMSGQQTMYSSTSRLEGFTGTLQSLNLCVPPEYIVYSFYEGTEATYKNAQRLLTLESPPTAVIAGNDQIALAVLHAAQDFGISVPQKLSIVGFDDIPDACGSTPPPTTIHQPLVEIGSTAAKILLKMLSDEQPATIVELVEPRLVVRDSTAPPYSPVA